MADRNDDDGDLHNLLETLDPKARDDLRRVLIHDDADRDAIAMQLDALPRRERFDA